jgi:cytochrome c
MTRTWLHAAGVLLTCEWLIAAGAMAQPSPQTPSAAPARFGIGRLATPAEIAARDIDVGPDGAGLPSGRGTAGEGAAIYATRCASCHGKTGTEGPNDVLVATPTGAGFPFAKDPSVPRAIGNYWPYATTLFDYIRRAMPPSAPGSLSDHEVYALVAHLLAWNGLIEPNLVIDAQSLPKVKMPARDRFVQDQRSVGPMKRPPAPR